MDMVKPLFFSTVLMMAMTGFALAQTPDLPAKDLPAKDMPTEGGAGVRTGNITPSGETVPNPGASQGAGTTSMDRGIQNEDNKIDSGICKGC